MFYKVFIIISLSYSLFFISYKIPFYFLLYKFPTFLCFYLIYISITLPPFFFILITWNFHYSLYIDIYIYSLTNHQTSTSNHLVIFLIKINEIHKEQFTELVTLIGYNYYQCYYYYYYNYKFSTTVFIFQLQNREKIL